MSRAPLTAATLALTLGLVGCAGHPGDLAERPALTTDSTCAQWSDAPTAQRAALARQVLRRADITFDTAGLKVLLGSVNRSCANAPDEYADQQLESTARFLVENS